MDNTQLCIGWKELGLGATLLRFNPGLILDRLCGIGHVT